MSDFVFAAALGRERTFCELAGAGDGLSFMLLQATGIQADDVLADHASFAAILAASNDEASFTGYTRKFVSTGITVGPVNTALNHLDIKLVDLLWNPAGGAVNNSIAKLVVGYSPTNSSPDADIIPLSAHDAVFTTDGTGVVIQWDPLGFLNLQGPIA